MEEMKSIRRKMNNKRGLRDFFHPFTIIRILEMGIAALILISMD